MKDFACDICGKCFTQAYYLKTHIKTIHCKEKEEEREQRKIQSAENKGQKNHQCEECPKG